MLPESLQIERVEKLVDCPDLFRDLAPRYALVHPWPPSSRSTPLYAKAGLAMYRHRYNLLTVLAVRRRRLSCLKSGVGQRRRRLRWYCCVAPHWWLYSTSRSSPSPYLRCGESSVSRGVRYSGSS